MYPVKLTHEPTPRSVAAPPPRPDGMYAAGGVAGGGPPMLIGGLIHTFTDRLPNIAHTGTGVDALTVTVSKADSQHLLAHTHLLEPGRPSQGFQNSEKRSCLGGDLWRKTHPYSPSKAHGLEYETWECTGNGSQHLLDLVTSLPNPLQARPSRVDVAFDYACDGWLYPSMVLDLPGMRQHIQHHGYRIDAAGDELMGSRYIGSSASGRQINIYRRDLKHEWLLQVFGPLLRVELRLRKKHAAAWYRHMLKTRTNGYAVAAGHVRDMILYSPQDDAHEVPALNYKDDDVDLAERFESLFDRAASDIDIAFRLGLDIESLARRRMDSASRMTKYRHAQKIEKLTGADVDAIEIDLVRRLSRRAHA